MRKGNIAIIIIIILVLLPSIIIFSAMATSGLKSLVRNKEFHQEVLKTESIKSIMNNYIKEELKKNLLKPSVDCEKYKGTTICGENYLTDKDKIIIGTGGFNSYISSFESLDSDFDITKFKLKDFTYEKFIFDTHTPLPTEATVTLSTTIETDEIDYLFQGTFNIKIDENGLIYEIDSFSKNKEVEK